MPEIPAGAKKPSDRRRAEESTETYTGTLDGVEIRVLPQGEWRKSANVSLRQGDWDGWAASAVHPEDVKQFKQLDPTNNEFSAFVTDALRHFGVDLGE
jgi:hypothetical protein